VLSVMFDEQVRHFDLVIIGTGSGNTIPNARFSGWDIAIVEHGKFGGTCLNVGCIPTKMFVHAADVAETPSRSSRLGVDEQLLGVRWADVRDRVFGRIDPIADGGHDYRANHPDNAKVTIYDQTARFVGPKQLDTGTGETITADQFVIAAGGRPMIPDIPGIADAGYHTSDTIMRIDRLPKRIVILGGGFIAAEFAHVFSSFGVQVTVINRSGRLLRGHDGDICTRFTELAAKRWDVRLNTTITRADRQNGVLRLHLDDGDVVETDELLVATGRVPNTDRLDVGATGVELDDEGKIVVDSYQRTSVEGIYALGDISSPYELKHVANHEARVVHHNLLHPEQPKKTDHRFVPHAVFTEPQIASVGLTEEQAREQDVKYVVAHEDYSSIAYGWAMEDTTGFAKVLADPDTGLLLGAHIIGPQASTLIQPLVQAMSFGQHAHAVATDQYWIHPAMPELIENALLKLPLTTD
jgi:mycothione reductase